eukprot:UN06461
MSIFVGYGCLFTLENIFKNDSLNRFKNQLWINIAYLHKWTSTFLSDLP